MTWGFIYLTLSYFETNLCDYDKMVKFRSVQFETENFTNTGLFVF